MHHAAVVADQGRWSYLGAYVQQALDDVNPTRQEHGKRHRGVDVAARQAGARVDQHEDAARQGAHKAKLLGDHVFLFAIPDLNGRL